RESETPQRADVPFVHLAQGLKRLKDSGGTYCFIDTPPTISEQSETVLGLADLVLIPVRPSPADLWAVSETVALVKAAAKPFLRAPATHRAVRRVDGSK
ncbi:Cobyrinic acid ac-diamide synthase, partial [mine drainage metagenome]